jgi:hypothetical protein
VFNASPGHGTHVCLIAASVMAALAAVISATRIRQQRLD